MRINQWLARASGLSRRSADTAIANGHVSINGETATIGQVVEPGDVVIYQGQPLQLAELSYIMLHKPVGYICSRAVQGKAPTIYEILPPELHHLKSVGRLDKDSSGLLVLTNDGNLAQQLSHPRHQKAKTYQIELDRPLTSQDHKRIETGVMLEDGVSKFTLTGANKNWVATLHEGRNRQVRRTFAALGYAIIKLHRTSFGKLTLGKLAAGQHRAITLEEVW